MIIKLKGANFSSNNINSLLNSWLISIKNGNCVTAADNISSVEKGESYTNTFTIKENFEVTGVVVTMGGEVLPNVTSNNGNQITINISSVTGAVSIAFTYNYNGGTVEPEEPTIQLTSSNTNSDYADPENHLNSAQTLGASLVKSNVGTKGIIGWDIPPYALVTLTVSSGGNYGMAITDTNDIVIESFSNGSVATDGDGTYTFSPVLMDSRLYVSTTKFVSASYVILSEDELSDYGFALIMSQSGESSQYINTSQTAGQPVAFAAMSGTGYLISNEIPANSTVTIKVVSGGNYGMVLADLNGNVLESKPSAQADADGNITFTKQSVPTKLWASKTKYTSGTYKIGG